MAHQLGSRRDEDAIRAVIVETLEGFNAHDARRATHAYMRDSDLVTVRGDALKGKAEIERRLTELFLARGKHAIQEMRDVRIRFIRDDVALAHVGIELNGVVAPDGQALPPHRELQGRGLVEGGRLSQYCRGRAGRGATRLTIRSSISWALHLLGESQHAEYAPPRRPLSPRPRHALPTPRQARAGPGASRDRDDDAPRDGHDLLAGEG